ncbi:MAG TPA: AsmA-like C-terminal region-containing protein [Thermohalobaculum sp.]|nr:AsmA-like C-terminal region-containing protein [Thermohalobaculum sp.]
MGFDRYQGGRVRTGGAGGLVLRPARAGARLAAWALRASLMLALVALVGGLVLTLRLAQGPIELPWLAALIAEEFNADGRGLSIRVDNLVLAAGTGEESGGLALTGVTLSDGSGVPVLSVPRLAARLDLFELLTGRLKPTEITVSGVAARLVRTEGGRFRFALSGTAAGAARADAMAGLGSLDALDGIIAGFVGERPPLPELARLTRITIEKADLTYVNAAGGRSWRSDRAELVLRQTPHGGALDLDLALISDRAGTTMAGAALEITAERRRLEPWIAIRAGFRNLRPEHLAEEVPALGWVRMVDAPLSGTLKARLSDEGGLDALSGGLAATGGRVLALEEDGMPFDRFQLDFAYRPDERRMLVERLAVEAPAADLGVSGFADLDAGADGRPRAVAAQLDIADLRLDLPRIFAEEQRFDGGQIVARIDLESRLVEVAEARLAQGPLTLSVEGRARPGADGWTSDLRVTGEDVAVERLVALWPLPAADGARSWLAEHLRTGTVDTLLAQMRFGLGPPQVNLDFRFSGLATSYLKDMSVIRQAAGRGHLTWQDLTLEVEEGRIEPLDGKPIYIGGSTVRLPDLAGRPAPAEIDIRARGPAASVLALIDQEPLGFLANVGVEPETVFGNAEVEVALTLPLANDLKLEQVGAEVEATVRGVAMPFSTNFTGPLRITSPQLEIAADTRGMTLSGDITADGTPLALDWAERYAGDDKGRDIRLAGRVTPAALAGIDLVIPGFDGGSAAVDLDLAQAPGAPTRIDVEADLTEAAVTVDPVLWSKAPGAAARVTARGAHDGRLVLDAFRLTGPGLEAEGALRLFPAGGIERARIDRLVLDDLLDLTVEAVAREGGFDLGIGGRWFDVAFFERGGDGPAVPPVTPLSGSYAVDQVRLTEEIRLGLVQGDFVRPADGRVEAELTGRVAGTAPVAISYTSAPGEPGRAEVHAADAGQALAAAGLFSSAEGGRLVLEATIAPEPGIDFEGEAVIRDVTLRQGAHAFGQVLEEGELADAAEEARSGGIRFDRVVVPFEVEGERIELGTTLATSPSLAVKLDGTVDEASGRLALRGVVSPAYALTGALNNIPLIGALLGGRGEGVVAMTFSVGGSVEEPEIAVNPLSLLAPGILRNLFEGGSFAGARPPPAMPDGPPAAEPRIADNRDRSGPEPESAATPEAAPLPPPRTPAEEAAADAEQAARLRELFETDF